MKKNREIIRGQVAKILNTRELVINKGNMDGVEIGMIFQVLDPKGEEIRDPSTNELLGSIERPKIEVKITDVQERLSIASTYRKKEINIGGSGPDLTGITLSFMPPKWIEKYETFKTKEAAWEDIEDEESFIKVGDPVKEVKEEDIE